MNKINLNQKGMEMAIQIFIVLFVLLAVSMLVLNLVSEQFQTQSIEIDRFSREQAIENRISQFVIQCNSYCTSNQAAQKANYCMSSISLSDELISSFDESLLAGIGVCNDKIYCPMVTDCANLNMSTCKNLLCNYWKGQNQDSNALLLRHFQPGDCYDSLSNDDKELHWFSVFDTSNDGSIDEDKRCS